MPTNRLLVVKKCCFYVPVRKGVIIFGYINLVISLLAIPILTYLLVDLLADRTESHKVKEAAPKASTEKPYDFTHRWAEPLVHLPITLACTTVDVIMNIVMLVGTHKKKKILLKVYLYFGVVFQLLMLVLDLSYFDFRDYIENAVYFICLCLNFYLLFLVNSVIHLIEESSEVQYTAYQQGNQLLLKV